ncbi:MAG: FGGY-family carbohydrate kinase [Candidatus Omnitrophota bacterium]
MSLLGIDVGTTGCKAVAFDAEGHILASAYKEYPLHSPQPGWAELDGNRVWDDVKSCIAKTADATKSDPITALAVSCQGEAVSLLDEKGNVLHNALVSFDNRTEPYISQWEERFGRQRIFEVTGQPLASVFTALKLQWIKEHKPEVLAKTKTILGFEDLVMFRLGMPPTTDYTLPARTMFFDVKKADWCDEFMEFAGVDRSMMPTPKPSGTLIGTIPNSIAGEIGLPHGVKVVTGGHDQPCQMLGAGVTKANVAAYGIGTVECIGPAFSELLINNTMLKNNICCYHHTCPQLYIALVYNFTGGILFRWYRDALSRDELRRARETGRDVYDILTEEAAQKPTNIIVLPHFTTTGVPHFDTRSKGVILGLTLGTTKAEITRGILEGITYEMRMCVELLKEAGGVVNVLRATGGGAKSEYWLQIKADIMNIPIEVPSVSEAGCLGCAILAGSATGVYSSVKEAAQQLARTGKTFEPQPENAKLYNERFEWYKEIYPRLKDIFHKMP